VELTLHRMLVIDDDIKLNRLLTEYFQPEGFSVESVTDGAAGVERALSGEYEIVVLDVMLPNINGFEVLRRIRAAEHTGNARVPVLMLTARGQDDDRIRGLEAGADDYLPKPFNPRELLARINAILRRVDEAASRRETRERLSIGDLIVDTGARTVWRAGREVELTAVEFDLLETLVRAAGRVVKRDELARKVLGRTLTPFDRSIDMHVSHLRRKLKAGAEEAERIKTVRNVGYLYVNPSGAT
jgi:two-component system, OmpR family, response regulator CpxR